MTPTEKGKRADALNQGPDTRRVLCDMIANREADLEDARAENAKLRELVQYILDECYGDDWFGKKAEELGFKANY